MVVPEEDEKVSITTLVQRLRDEAANQDRRLAQLLEEAAGKIERVESCGADAIAALLATRANALLSEGQRMMVEEALDKMFSEQVRWWAAPGRDPEPHASKSKDAEAAINNEAFKSMLKTMRVQHAGFTNGALGRNHSAEIRAALAKLLAWYLLIFDEKR